jgi:prepilin peptidase CpaA
MSIADVLSTRAALAAPLALASGALTWAAVSDIRRYLIPNAAPIAIAAGYAAAALSRPPAFAIGGCLTGAAVFAVGAAVFRRGGLGGGDVKLLAAIALWAGPTLLKDLALGAALGALALAGLLLSPLRRWMPRPPAEAVALAGGDGALRQPMPFGAAIAAGGLYTLSLYLPLPS